MANNAGIPSEDIEVSLFDTNTKFDPSDYLPRRTSRASAHAASKAIKKTVKEDKTDPGRKNAPSEEAQEQRKEPSRAGKAKSSAKAKRRHPSHTPYDCHVKLVPCEQDPAQKKWMADLDKRNKNPESEYKVVYGPASCQGLFKAESQTNGALVPKTATAEGGVIPSAARQRKSKYLDGYPSGPPAQPAKPASLNVVVVHPKPGSKIVNATTGRQSKSARLHELISDPDVVISSEVSRIMTSGGNAELRCDQCSKTYAKARDLVNHKRLAHKASPHMCITCARDLRTAEELAGHKCKVKNQCDVCGAVCKSINVHKQKAHPKTLGSYMCPVCCFNASSQEQLGAHVCGGRPKIKYSARGSSAVMVFPPSAGGKPKAGGGSLKPLPNTYVNLAEAVVKDEEEDEAGSRSSPMQFLCEVCLNMYPSSAALAAHTCDTTVEVVDPDASPQPGSSKVPVLPRAPAPPPPPPAPAAVPVPPVPGMSLPSPMLPLGLGMEVMPEVEQLAKFYSSVVFKE